MGGTQGWGTVTIPPDEPVFDEPWEAKAFAFGALSARLSGQNLNAMRHAIDRQHPYDYLADGYYGRWLACVETMLVDSGVLAPGAVVARARKLRGEGVNDHAHAGHTRLPRYTRDHVGTVAAIHPAQVLPDTHAHFIAENAQHVYAVAFDSTELWGDDAEPFTLTLDLYDDYLEPFE
jgi:nitrile hydratase subunit beta